MASKNIAIFGVGGFGRDIAQLISDEDDVVFVSDLAEDRREMAHGRRVIDFDELTTDAHRRREVIIAIADSTSRRRIAERCEKAGLTFGSIVADTHRRGAAVTIGAGAALCHFTLVTNDAVIGRHCHLHMYSYVAHDCVLGDFVTFAPRVSCNGNVTIGDDVFVGTGAIIRNGEAGSPLRIGDGAVIGMGAVVTGDVAAGHTVFGVPARVVRP